MKQKTIFGIMMAGGAIGMVSAFLQTLQKITSLQNKDKLLPCDFNDVFNCTTVFNAWQSSVFGFPNSMMCMVLFTIFASVALVGVVGTTLPRGLRLGIHGLALFTLGFASWFLWQSTFVIGALCIFCLFCFAGLLMVNWAWLRINAADLPIGKKARDIAQHLVQKGYDTLLWVTFGAAVGVTMVARFTL